MPDPQDNKELVLGPTEYAYVLDETKGHINVYVGPHKVSLSNTDRPVCYDEKTGRFTKTDLTSAIKAFTSANEGSYLVLQNPTAENNKDTPKTGSGLIPPLLLGRKINIPGPKSFALWPQQTVRVIDGHRLRTNEYLLVRVCNDKEAEKNWEKAIINPQTSTLPLKTSETETTKENEPEKDNETPENTKKDKNTFVMGQLIIIKGTDVSFYIPPTGIEVVPEEGTATNFVRKAITLERLEYCILLDEDGNKRYVQGPAVVFPRPTETFIKNENGSCKLKAIELTEIMGIYVKVIADYTDDDGKEHKTGEELFITGKTQKIYFPRPEHAIIKYGKEFVHFAVAIPKGEGRYVLEKNTGKVKLVTGPIMFLPDPRTEVIVQRILDKTTVELWFPGNSEAILYNQKLQTQPGRNASESETKSKSSFGLRHETDDDDETSFISDDFSRRTSFTPPPSITLNTKYEGAVLINVWPGYAIQIVNKIGERKIVRGPKSVLLEYDETLEGLVLSTGTPKTDKNTIKTVYLLAENNKVSDVIEAETKDFVKVNIKLSYRVNFENDSSKWFSVGNYIKLLTDHLRSMIRNVVKQKGIEEFNNNAISIIRDSILGKSLTSIEEGSERETTKRTGRIFEENNMRVYDVEVLDIIIGDDEIQELLASTQQKIIEEAVKITSEKTILKSTLELELIKREKEEALIETEKQKMVLQQKKKELSESIALDNLKMEMASVTAALAVELEKIKKEITAKTEKQKAESAEQEHLNKINNETLAREKAKETQKNEFKHIEQERRLEELRVETMAIVERAKAFGPEVVAALQQFSDKLMLAKVAESMSPIPMFGDDSLKDVVDRLFKGTILSELVGKEKMKPPENKTE